MFRSDRGSAILEFITVVLVMQTLILSGAMFLAQTMFKKVELQLEVSRLGLSNPNTLGTMCSENLRCFEIVRDGLQVRAVGFDVAK